MKTSKTGSLFIVLLCYILAIAAGYFSWPLFKDYSLYLQILYIDIVATLVVFAFSFIFRNSSMYDPYWSVIPPFIAWAILIENPEGNTIRQILVIVAILFWSIRLTLNWIRGWAGLHHEDWRYQNIASKTGNWYWLSSLGGIHLLPTLFVYLGCLPLFYSLNDTSPIGIFDILGFFICCLATSIEYISDEQLRTFKKLNRSGEYIRSGLWQYSRHPNYFGETLFWFGLFIFVIPIPEGNALWTVVGMLSMFVLFKYISIPMMDKHNLEKRKGYEIYMKEVPSFVPLGRNSTN